MPWCTIILAALFCLQPAAGQGTPAVTPQADGFRGIWFELGQKSEFGDKYSGGLGTYTANHVPMAHYVEKVNRTYFTWGGTPAAKERRLQILVSYYDHSSGKVARPVIVMDKSPVDDPHDNASLSIDGEGHLWVFVSGRGNKRPGVIYRSKVPYDINEWLNLGESEFTYPQPWWFEGKGFLHTYTRYTPGRELYYRTSPDGSAWSDEKKLAGLEGHYQTSAQVGGRLITAFNRHPGRNVDRRTDLYYMETADMGETWTTADGKKLTTPLTKADSPARIRDYSAEKLNVYIHDTTADADDRPVILYTTAMGHAPGPDGAPRSWTVARWTGAEWLFHPVTTSTHNYDTGSIHIGEDGTWIIIGPTGTGPQKWGCGGEIELWASGDQGATWAKQREVTRNSPRNHSYVRRPQNAHPDFHAYWADGDADKLSESHLYFTNRTGDKVWRLPYEMTGDFAVPELLEP
jgi:BNR repeat-containing family member